MTIVMGFGVAIIQPALPTLVRAMGAGPRRARHRGRTNGMLVGVVAGPRSPFRWCCRWSAEAGGCDLLVWSVPGLVAALLFLLACAAPPSDERDTPRAGRWWPDWKNPLIWLLGFTFGSNNALFYAVNAFLPDYLDSLGRADLIGAGARLAQRSQFVASFMLLATPERLQRRAWPYHGVRTGTRSACLAS